MFEVTTFAMVPEWSFPIVSVPIVVANQDEGLQHASLTCRSRNVFEVFRPPGVEKETQDGTGNQLIAWAIQVYKVSLLTPV